MNVYNIDLINTVFWLFCGYSLYTALVTFFRADNWGHLVFQNLQKPLLVSLYFILPCVALYVLRRTYGYLDPTIFWTISLTILGLSFFLMLYILAVPEWPVGRFTQIHKVPLFFIRFLLSVNFAMSLLVTVVSCYILFRVPEAVREQHGPEVTKLQTQAAAADQDQRQRLGQIRTIQQESTAKILKEGMDLIKAAGTVLTTLATAFGSYKALHRGSSKKSKSDEAATPRPRGRSRRR
jgi:hypothetical protein